MIVIVDAAIPEEDHHCLLLLSQLFSHNYSAVLLLLGLTKKIFQVFGPLYLLQFLMAFTYLIFEELLDFELRQALPLRERPPALGDTPRHLGEPALLAPGDHGRRAFKIDRLGHFL